jgi:hypothetical protein
MSVDGLFTNDKFCHTRFGRLELKPPRRAQNKLASSGQASPSVVTQQPGGVNETQLEHPSPASSDPNRPAALGSGLSTPARLEPTSSFGARVSTKHRGGRQ